MARRPLGPSAGMLRRAGLEETATMLYIWQ
jgi:hypothetical protein